jgi:hypothetical protein
MRNMGVSRDVQTGAAAGRDRRLKDRLQRRHHPHPLLGDRRAERVGVERLFLGGVQPRRTWSTPSAASNRPEYSSRTGWAFVAEPRIGAFLGLDAGEAVELGELLAFFSDWLASDPDRLEAALYEFVGVPDYVGPACGVDELRAEVDRFARLLLGYYYYWANGEEPQCGRICELHWGTSRFIVCFRLLRDAAECLRGGMMVA